MKRAVFLDRDGTIAEDVNYCRRVEDFRILPGVPEAIRLLNESGFKVIVITNQSGIARGYFTDEILARTHENMESELAGAGARVDAIYYCPHHPDDGCECRKPKPGMFLRAARELVVDLISSFMIGDAQGDIEGGQRAGCRTVLVTTGPKGGKDVTASPDCVAGSLLEAVQWIINNARVQSSALRNL